MNRNAEILVWNLKFLDSGWIFHDFNFTVFLLQWYVAESKLLGRGEVAEFFFLWAWVGGWVGGAAQSKLWEWEGWMG
jgi:hypothetical protein